MHTEFVQRKSADKAEVKAPALDLAPLTSERFGVIFPDYIGASDEKRQMLASYDELFDSLFLQRDKNSILSLCDLACGNGETTRMLLQALEKRHSRAIEIFARDKDPEMVKAYSTFIAEKKENVFCLLEQKDAFANLPNCFADITFVSHGLYHITEEQVPGVLSSIHRTLAPHGMALISLLSEASDFNVIQNNFVSKLQNAEASHLKVSISSMEMLSNAAQGSPDVLENSQIIPYNASLFLPITQSDFSNFRDWAISETAENQPVNYTKTKNLLEFMLHRDWASLAAAGHLPDYLDLIQGLLHSDSEDKGGQVVLNLAGSTLVLKKQ
jgi:SAM-dependent methyltransferase